MRTQSFRLPLFALLLTAPLVLAQQPTPSGWQRAANAAAAQQVAQAAPPPAGSQEAVAPPAAVDPRDSPILTLPAGTWITVRVDQMLSSKSNHSGDPFTASLAKPLVASGLVVASRGQTVGGVVAEAGNAGRVKGTAQLAIELNELSLVDGRQIPIRTTLVSYDGGTSHGADAVTVGTVSGMGALIGAAADGGSGAGIGALAGAGAGLIGVLTTRGRAVEIYPEALVTFRLDEAVTIATAGTAYAFRPVTTEDYQLGSGVSEQPRLTRRNAAPPPPRVWLGPSWGYGRRGYGRSRIGVGISIGRIWRR